MTEECNLLEIYIRLGELGIEFISCMILEQLQTYTRFGAGSGRHQRTRFIVTSSCSKFHFE